MVEINNQRKAFLDMLAWSEELITDVRKPNHGYDVIVGGELFTDYSDHPRKLYAANPKLKSAGAGRYQLLSVGGMPTASSLAWKTSLESQDAVALQQIRSVALFWLVVVISVRQSRPLQQYLGFTAGRWLWSVSSIKMTAWLQIQRSRRDDWSWCMSRVTAIISALVILIVCLSWAVNHYRDNAITYKAQRDKNTRELKLANAVLTCRCTSAWCCCARCKIHEGVSWC